MQSPLIGFKLFHITNFVILCNSHLCLILVLLPSHTLILNIQVPHMIMSLMPISYWRKVKLLSFIFSILILFLLIWFFLFVATIFDDLSQLSSAFIKEVIKRISVLINLINSCILLNFVGKECGILVGRQSCVLSDIRLGLFI